MSEFSLGKIDAATLSQLQGDVDPGKATRIMLADLLAHRRAELNINQTSLAKSFRVPQCDISTIESGGVFSRKGDPRPISTLLLYQCTSFIGLNIEEIADIAAKHEQFRQELFTKNGVLVDIDQRPGFARVGGKSRAIFRKTYSLDPNSELFGKRTLPTINWWGESIITNINYNLENGHLLFPLLGFISAPYTLAKELRAQKLAESK